MIEAGEGVIPSPEGPQPCEPVLQPSEAIPNNCTEVLVMGQRAGVSGGVAECCSNAGVSDLPHEVLCSR